MQNTRKNLLTFYERSIFEKNVSTNIGNFKIIQRINSDSIRCHDNARCDTMWARRNFCMIDMRQKRWSLNNRILWFGDASSSTGTTKEICSASGGLPPMHKRKQYYESLEQMA